MGNSSLIQNKELIRESINGSENDVDMILSEVKRVSGLSFLNKYPFLFHGLLAMLSSFLYALIGMNKKVDITDDDFVFVSCPDSVFRTKSIDALAGNLKYSVIYLPNFHIQSAIKYYKYFKKKNIQVFFPTIHLKDVFKARRSILEIKQKYDIHSECNILPKLISVLSSYLIYDNVVKEFLKKDNSFKGKWILEYDKFYFMPMVSNIHRLGQKCTMLQHGCFMEIDSDFLPLFCDKVLCCSERERNAYISNGIKPERVITFGAPLQTISVDDEFDVKDKNKYSLLILLTFANDESLHVMQSVLAFVKENYTDVIVRLRPRSKKNDIKLLGSVLNDFCVSNNNSLSMDIACCSKVISFSEDANIEVTKYNKPFVYIHPWTGNNRELRRDIPYTTIDNYKEEIKKLMENDFYSTFSKEQYKDIVGETDVEVLKQRFEKYIRS